MHRIVRGAVDMFELPSYPFFGIRWRADHTHGLPARSIVWREVEFPGCLTEVLMPIVNKNLDILHHGRFHICNSA